MPLYVKNFVKKNNDELIAIFLCCFTFILTGQILIFYNETFSLFDHLINFFFIFIISLLFPRKNISKPFKFLLRCLNIITCLYISWTIFPYILFDYANINGLNFYILLFIILLCISCLFFNKKIYLSIFPAYLFKVAYQIINQEYYFEVITTADYVPLIELTICIYFLKIILFNFKKIYQIKTISHFFNSKIKILNNVQFQDTLFYLVILMHLANYFYSGFIKMTFENFYFWTFYNPFHYNPISGILHSTVPLYYIYPAFISALVLIYKISPIIGNSLVILHQFLSPLAILNRKFMLVALVIFDIFHIVVFLYTGIFFWKWILINAILFYIFYKNDIKIKSPLLIICCIPLLTFLSIKNFNIMALAWLDGNHSLIFKIKTKLNDKLIDIPSNHFFAHSFNMTGPWLINRNKNYNSNLPTFIWGTTHNTDDFMKSKQFCDMLNKKHDVDFLNYRKIEFRKNFENFLKRYHNIALNFSKISNQIIDFYPHHVWSMPSNFNDYYNLNFRKIDTYIVELKEVCIYPEIKENFDFDFKMIDGYHQTSTFKME